jgi:hypothetical protein
MPWAAAATVVGGYLTSKAAKSGAQAQTSANNAAIGEQQREFDQTQQNLAPYLGAGSNALNLQQQYLSGNTSGFDQSPDYQFAVQQGTKALDAGAASKGNLWGGGADADRISLGQGLATQYANNYWNKLTGVANQGLGAATSLGSLGQSNANNIGNLMQGSGQANASGTVGSANAWQDVLSQLGTLYGTNSTKPVGGTVSSYSLGNNLGSYWTNPNYASPGGNGSYNFASMSGGA